MTEQPDSCANCHWARRLSMEEASKTGNLADGMVSDSTISCHRFPQAVVNSVTYFCGEHIQKREAAAP